MTGGTFDGLAPEDTPLQSAEATNGESTAGERPEGSSAGSEHRRSHGRLHTLVAISIATVSVLGATASWRIEDHATTASELDQSAVAATITASRLTVEARTQAQESENAYFRFLRLGGEAGELAPAGCPTNPKTVLEFDAVVACELDNAVFIGGDDQYVSSDLKKYDVARLTRDLVAVAGFEQDHDPAPYEAAAQANRHAEDRLLLLTMVLVLSLALLTVANLAKKRSVVLRSAVPAWALMAGSAVLLAAWEL